MGSDREQDATESPAATVGPRTVSQDAEGGGSARARPRQSFVTGGGSGLGVKAVTDATAHIGMVSRPIKDEDKQRQANLDIGRWLFPAG